MEIREELRQAAVNVLMKYMKDVGIHYPELMNALTVPHFKAVDTGVHPKLMADWNRKGLLLVGDHQKNKRHLFTLPQFTWIKLVEVMRAYGFSSELILDLRSAMTEQNGMDVESFLSDPMIMDAIADMMPPEFVERVRLALAQPEVRKQLLKHLPLDAASMTLLDAMVLFVIAVRKPMAILLDHTGFGAIFSPVMMEENIRMDEFYETLARTHVSISITEAVAASLAVAPIEKITGNMQFVTDQEAQVLKAMKEDNVASIEVRFDVNGQPELLEVTRKVKVTGDQRLMEMILSKGYHDITVKTQHGKVVYCENTRKMKL